MYQSLLEENWDYLIILDACRYDYFERLWKDYLPPEGYLSCKKSAGSCTNEWRDNSFSGYYEEIVYITANPQINLTTPVYGYCAKDHFKYVYEIWKDSWDEKQGTVLPESVTQRAIEIIPQYNHNKRFIIHYIQPHAPYLTVDYLRFFLSLEQFTDAQMLSAPPSEVCKSKLKRHLFKLLLKLFKNNRLLTNQPEWVLRKALGMAPILPMEVAWRNLGVRGLREAYESNLKAALPCVSKLIDSLDGTVVVTSDHGELLGENRRFGHPAHSDDPILRDVPWYLLEKPRGHSTGRDFEKSVPSPASDAEDSQENKQQQDQAVMDRLRALGYCQ